MMLTNGCVSAADEAVMGLVTRVVAAEDLAGEAAKLAALLADGLTAALGSVRYLLAASSGSTLADRLEREEGSIAAAADGAEDREGVTAFLARRKPMFWRELESVWPARLRTLVQSYDFVSPSLRGRGPAL